MHRWGVIAAVLSSSIGGTTIVATRYLSGSIDPEMLGSLRFGLAALLLLPVALLQAGPRVPLAMVGRILVLGLLLFTAQPLLFNSSLIFTTAARAALAMSTMPLLTMLLAAAVGVEQLTRRRSLGVMVAMVGVAVALIGGLGDAPPDAWIGDLIMLACSAVMAVFNVACRPVIGKIGVIPFTCQCMLAGILPMWLAAGLTGDVAQLPALTHGHWIAIVYLGSAGGVASFLLWSYALKVAPPTLASVTVSLNPVVALFVGALWLGESIGAAQIAGLVAVILGIYLAASSRRAPAIPAD